MLVSSPFFIRLNVADNVVVALADLKKGLDIGDQGVTCLDTIPSGHKIATAVIDPGAPVKKYGQIIGFATRLIRPGEHVHTHNLTVGDFDRDYVFGADRSREVTLSAEKAVFAGIVRPDGKAATRNYIGVISSVNCSASVCRLIADEFRGSALDGYARVDGVVPIVHGTGCGMAAGGDGYDYLMNTVTGYLRHPNFAGVLLVGLGCEVMQIDAVIREGGFNQGRLFRSLTIQETGGIRAAMSRGAGYVREMLPGADAVERTPVPADRLVLGLQCGGSDGYSGITANPALGAAVDLLVGNGGTAILGETPEIYGAEHLLTRRAVSPEAGRKLVERIRWWEAYTRNHGGEMDNNPTPGNKAGGLTTILEKSLGAVAKGGSTHLVDVYRYAQPVTAKGLVFMDTPGYDPVSLTGMVAGGANIICFTTGRGSVYGCRPVPSIKLATHTDMYTRLAEDMDVNCGVILDGEASVEEMGQRVFDLILETASGEKTKSEMFGVGDLEFLPWMLGAVM